MLDPPPNTVRLGCELPVISLGDGLLVKSLDEEALAQVKVKASFDCWPTFRFTTGLMGLVLMGWLGCLLVISLSVFTTNLFGPAFWL